MTELDWRYSPERMLLREGALSFLLTKYGGQMDGVVPKYPSQKIFECAHDWVSQGNNDCDGILDYFKNNYYAEQ